MRGFDALCLAPIQELTPKKARDLRTREKASQTVFAAFLNRLQVSLENGKEAGSVPPLHRLSLL